jgi:hypothetical protein
VPDLASLQLSPVRKISIKPAPSTLSFKVIQTVWDSCKELEDPFSFATIHEEKRLWVHKWDKDAPETGFLGEGHTMFAVKVWLHPAK